MDTYADDLAQLVKELRLTDVILVGHASGGGEVARYVGRHGTKHVRKIVLVAAVPPLMLQTATNMEGTPIAAFDDLRIGLSRNRPEFYKGLGAAYYGADRPGAKVSPALLEQFWLLSMQAGLHGAYECIKAFSETDFTDDLRKFDVPTLVVHGDEDQVVPIHASALHAAELIKDATLKVYEGAPHGLTATHRDQFNADLLEFIEA
jgi:non-heme chloroperoxidase